MGLFKWVKVFVFLVLLTVVSAYLLGEIYYGPSGNVAHIKIIGEISTQSDFVFNGAISDEIIGQLEEAKSNPDVKAIFLEINSPGGSAIATKEISKELKEINKTKVCWLRETATSGAYWIASNCDYIVADKFTITGSIGATGSFLEFSKFFEKYGINYVRVISGDKKDMASPYRAPTEEELNYLQKIVNELKEDFVLEVARNRNLKIEDVEKIADGRVFLGKDAYKLGLIDELGGKEEAINATKRLTNLTDVEFYEFEEKVSFSKLLSAMLAESFWNNVVEKNLKLKI